MGSSGQWRTLLSGIEGFCIWLILCGRWRKIFSWESLYSSCSQLYKVMAQQWVLPTSVNCRKGRADNGIFQPQTTPRIFLPLKFWSVWLLNTWIIVKWSERFASSEVTCKWCRENFFKQFYSQKECLDQISVCFKQVWIWSIWSTCGK